MANKQQKQKMTPEQQQYEQLQQKHEIKRPILKNCLKAFLCGGFICVVGQAITYFYIYFFNFTEQTASNPTVATMIFISMLLTGFGVYDRIGQFGGAGSAVPITGFGNAVISAAIEHRTEGFVLVLEGICLNLPDQLFYLVFFQRLLLHLIKTFSIILGVI